MRIYLDRAALEIPYDIPLSIWLRDKTYYFKVRYIVRVPEGHSYKTIISPYSNTAVLGRDAAASALPQPEVPSGINSASYINASSWAVPELDRAVSPGLVVDSIKGNMQQNITREEFAEVALKLYECLTGKTETAQANPFFDTSSPAVISAARLGIVAGVGQDRFDPQGLITREQLGAMLHRLILLIEPEAGAVTTGGLQFKDEAAISAFARDAMGFTSYGVRL